MIVGEPSEFYLSYFSSENGKGHTIAKQIHSIIAKSNLKYKLILVGTDSTASMTSCTNGYIAWLEHMLHRLLQWAVCLPNCNKLPLYHLLATLDSLTTSLDTLFEPISKQLDSCKAVLEWSVKNFCLIFVLEFSTVV